MAGTEYRPTVAAIVGSPPLVAPPVACPACGSTDWSAVEVSAGWQGCTYYSADHEAEDYDSGEFGTGLLFAINTEAGCARCGAVPDEATVELLRAHEWDLLGPADRLIRAADAARSQLAAFPIPFAAILAALDALPRLDDGSPIGLPRA